MTDVSTTHPSALSLRSGTVALALSFAVAVTACSDDPLPTESEHSHDDAEATEDLSVDLTVSPDHVHILSEVTFTALVTDHHGDPVTDFDVLRVERKAADGDTWRHTDLELSGEAWEGSHTFTSSGEYEIRVAGQRPDDAEPVVMYEMPEHLHAGRAHTDAGGYRVEFEAFPGHIHAGDEATPRFWVLEQEADDTGERPPITGLAAEIHVTEADGSEAHHTAAETDPGVYEADHTFGSVGDASVELHFTGADGSGAEAGFTIHIVEPHGHGVAPRSPAATSRAGTGR